MLLGSVLDNALHVKSIHSIPFALDRSREKVPEFPHVTHDCRVICAGVLGAPSPLPSRRPP